MSQDFSKEVEYIARLSRLTLEPDEAGSMAEQLKAILDIARKIQDLDTSDIEPTTHVINVPTLMREDEVKASMPVQQVLSNAAKSQNGYFVAPSIIRGDDAG